MASFRDPEQARRAIEGLRRHGFRKDHIGYALRRPATHDAGDALPDRAEAAAGGAAGGAVGGGVIGGLAGVANALLLPGVGAVIAGGALAAVLGSLATGAAIGGVLGALVGMGTSEEEGRQGEQELQAGRVIVTVACGGRCREALRTLRRYQLYEAPATQGGPAAASSGQG